MSKIYGYCRISKKKQNITRQVENILREYPLAEIKQEAFTGTKVEGRKEFNKLLKVVTSGDTIVFDSVSRMSRNAKDGIRIYFELFERGINLVFLKEGYINTSVYKDSIQQSLPSTGNDIADIYIEATNKVIKLLAEKQIEKAFDQSEKEVTDIQERTKEGLRVARANGKQIGQKQGIKMNIKKKEPKKADIMRLSRDFQGTYTDKEVMDFLHLARNTYYKYKKELAEELKEAQNA